MHTEEAANCKFAKSLESLFSKPDGSYWVAGGCFASLVTGARPNDYDIFSSDPASAEAKLKEIGFKETYRDERVVNLRLRGVKAQVVLLYKYASMEETISAFDFTVCCAAFDGKNFVCHDRFFQDVAQKTLVINSLPKPLSTLSRVIRYARKGYNICPVGLGTVIRAITEMNIDWNDPNQNEIEFYPDGKTPRFRGLD